MVSKASLRFHGSLCGAAFARGRRMSGGTAFSVRAGYKSHAITHFGKRSIKPYFLTLKIDPRNILSSVISSFKAWH